MRLSWPCGDVWAHLRRRRTLVWAAVHAVLGAALCAVPLFDLLGYEFSLAMAVVGSLASAHLGTVQGRALTDPGIWRTFASAAVAHLLLLVPPLAMISLNAFRVRNCDYLEGLALFALLPGLSVLCATAVGVCAGVLVRRPWRAAAAALSVVFGSWALAALRFYAEPPVHAFDPFFGYLPGALYDEDVAATPALMWYRAMNLIALAGCLWAVAQRPLRALLALSAGVAIYAQGASLGFRGSAEEVGKALGGRHDTEHFTVFFRDDARARDPAAIGRDHEFRYAQLVAAMGVRPGRKVRAYLFSSASEKRRVLGAGQTFVAKPWRDEIYLQEGEPPQPALRHELVHVFGAQWSRGALGIPPNFDLGLVEGLAVALDWPSEEGLDPHAQSKCLRDARMLPPIRTVFGAGFLRHAPARAYVVAGSFIRHVLDRYGRDALRSIYQTGEFESVLSRSLTALEDEWHAALDGVAIDAVDRAAVEDRLRRPSIWRRVCAHEIALLSQEANLLLSARPWQAAGVLSRIANLEPGDPAHLLEWGAALDKAGRPAEARAAFTRVLAHRQTSRSLRKRAHTALGDLEWTRGRLPAAAAAYDQAANEPGGEAERRGLALKRLAIRADEGARTTLRAYLLQSPGEKRDPFVDALLLARLATQLPDSGLPGYLTGRQLVQRGRFCDALSLLRPACAAPLPNPDFLRECLRLWATAAWRCGAPDDAGLALPGLRAPRADGGDAAFARDLGERIAWERRTRGAPPSP